MHKKLMLACMAVAAVSAFVIAPAAFAKEPTLTSEGKIVPVGTSITAKNTGNTVFTGAFSLMCDHVHLTWTVTKNSTPGGFAGSIPVGWAQFNGTGASTDCTSAIGTSKVTVNSKLCLESVGETDTVRITGCGANITFTVEITGNGPCRYSTASVSGVSTTNNTPPTVNAIEEPASGAGEGNGFFCPASGKLDMDVDFYTTNGAGITISPAP